MKGISTRRLLKNGVDPPALWRAFCRPLPGERYSVRAIDAYSQLMAGNAVGVTEAENLMNPVVKCVELSKLTQ